MRLPGCRNTNAYPALRRARRRHMASSPFARPLVALFGLTTILASSSGCSCSSPSGGTDGGVDGSANLPDGGVDGSIIPDGSTDGALTGDGDINITDGGVVLVDAGDGGTTECFVKICIDSLGRQIDGQCGDCLDNDDDGLADERDPECLNFCDDHEATYSFFDPGSGGGDTPNCNLDCYYDPDVGSGNDGCGGTAAVTRSSPTRSARRSTRASWEGTAVPTCRPPTAPPTAGQWFPTAATASAAASSRRGAAISCSSAQALPNALPPARFWPRWPAMTRRARPAPRGSATTTVTTAVSAASSAWVGRWTTCRVTASLAPPSRAAATASTRAYRTEARPSWTGACRTTAQAAPRPSVTTRARRLVRRPRSV
jgi:hypothetical protein